MGNVSLVSHNNILIGPIFCSGKNGIFWFSLSTVERNCRSNGLILEQKLFWVLFSFEAMIEIDNVGFQDFSLKQHEAL